MQYKFYQLDGERPHFRDLAFRTLGEGQRVDLGEYILVHTGAADETVHHAALETLFWRFNNDHPDGFTGRSMSVSDIVLLNGDAYYCQNAGWISLAGRTEGRLAA